MWSHVDMLVFLFPSLYIVDFAMHCPLRVTKKQTRTDLLSEYARLNKPGAGKSLKEVIRDVEVELSSNITFEVEEGKDKGGKVQLILKTGNQSVALPEDKKWKKQVFIEPKTNIPFVSDGSTSVHCIRFFQDEEKADDTEAPHPPAHVNVPLPGAPTHAKPDQKEGPFSSEG